MWPIKILRFAVLVQVLLVICSSGYVNGIPPSHTRNSRQIIPLAQGTFNNILQSMSEGAKAVRLVVSRPFQRLRNFSFLGGSSTTPKPTRTRPQKQTLDLSEVHYHYDDFGNRIENPKEYLKGFKNSISHSHSHIGDASSLPENVLHELEMKEELKFEQDVDSGAAFSYEYGKMPAFKSNFHNSQFNSFGGFESTTHHTDDWTPTVHKAKPASSLHTNVAGTSDNIFGPSNKFLNPRPITNFKSVKHYDSDRPSTSYSFHHFASPSVDFGVDTKDNGGSFNSPLASGSMKVQNFDHFYDYFDKKFKDHHGSESQLQPISQKSSAEEQSAAAVPQAVPLVAQKAAVPSPTTTHKPTTTATHTTRSRPSSARTSSRAPVTKSSATTERPNYPEYFFTKPKPDQQPPKFIPVRNIRDEEELFKGSMAQFPMPPAKFVPHSPKFPMHAHSKEPLHIVVGQPVNDKASLKAKEKFRKQQEDKRISGFAPTIRKRYPTTRPPVRIESTSAPSPAPQTTRPTSTQPPVFYTEGYAQNEVSGAEVERKYPKKYQSETTTTAKVRARPNQSTVDSPKPSAHRDRGAVRARGSVKFGARL